MFAVGVLNRAGVTFDVVLVEQCGFLVPGEFLESSSLMGAVVVFFFKTTKRRCHGLTLSVN